ncbi:hypothetical protein niasHT_001318 [Heterodera trifolii]|uniref:Uncharacterized protein n=1 Tax=Heterodera trifolii TaxID=157864 RepID=A0ABD2LRY5_9BILA
MGKIEMNHRQSLGKAENSDVNKWTELWGYQQRLGMSKMVTHHFWHWNSKSQFLCKKAVDNLLGNWGGAAANGRTTIDGSENHEFLQLSSILKVEPSKLQMAVSLKLFVQFAILMVAALRAILSKPNEHLGTQRPSRKGFGNRERSIKTLVWRPTDKAHTKPTHRQNKSGRNFWSKKARPSYCFFNRKNLCYQFKCCVHPKKQYQLVKRNTNFSEDLVNELRKKDECAGEHMKLYS